MVADALEDNPGALPDIASRLGRAKAFLRQYRLPIGVIATLIFITGVIWSITSLNIAIQDIRWLPILAIFAIMAPVMLIYGGIGLLLLARTLAVEIGYFASIRFAAAAQLAEALPLPGGAMIRTAVLINAGGQVKKSALLVTATALLWISLAAALAGCLLFFNEASHGIWLLLGGLFTAVPVLVWIAKQAGISIACFMLIHRSVGLGLMIIRLTLAFAAVQIVVSPDAAALFAFASIAGSAASIAPAGLGVSETIAAFSASLVSVTPAAAFLAVALNRITGLMATGVISLIMEFSAGRTKESVDG